IFEMGSLFQKDILLTSDIYNGEGTLLGNNNAIADLEDNIPPNRNPHPYQKMTMMRISYRQRDFMENLVNQNIWGIQEAHGEPVWDNVVLNMGLAHDWPMRPQQPQAATLHPMAPAAQDQLVLDTDDNAIDVDSISSSNNALVRRGNQNCLPFHQARESSLWGSFPISLNLQSSEMLEWVSFFISK
ncbi:hypothetical protein ACJX0J_022337, partial [Zea mays]